MSLDLPRLRKVVTGIDASGRSVFIEDASPPVQTVPRYSGLRFSHVWATGQAPAPVGDPDRSHELRGLMPLEGGSLLNVVDFPPEPTDSAQRQRALAELRDAIAAAGLDPEPGLKRYPDGPHPGMHRTDTLDYAIVLSGEIHAVLESEEKLLKAGDVLIQRGTVHSWSNRSGRFCRVAFVLVHAKH